MMIDTKAPALDAGFATPHAVAIDNKTRLVFNALAMAAAAMAALLPLSIVIYWFTLGADEAASSMAMNAATLGAFDPALRLGAALTGLLATAPLSWGLLRLRRCFLAFALGRPFSAQGIAGLRDFAIGTGLSVVLKPVSTALLSILLSWNAGAGQRQVILQFSSDLLVTALFAAVIAALAWAMEKAAAIAEENSQFI